MVPTYWPASAAASIIDSVTRSRKRLVLRLVIVSARSPDSFDIGPLSPPNGVGNTDGIPFVGIEMRGRFLWLVVPHQQGCSPISETMMGFGFPGPVRILSP